MLAFKLMASISLTVYYFIYITFLFFIIFLNFFKAFYILTADLPPIPTPTLLDHPSPPPSTPPKG